MTLRGEELLSLSKKHKEILIGHYELKNPEHGRIADTFLKPLPAKGSYYEDKLNIKLLVYTAPADYRRVIFKYLPEITIQDYKYTAGAAYYEHSVDKGRGIYVNLASGWNFTNHDRHGITDRRGPYYSFFHELGHAIDHGMTGFFDENDRYAYASTSFFGILEADVFGHIEDTVSKYAGGNVADVEAVMEAIRYNGNPDNLTNKQLQIYYDVIDEYSDKNKQDIASNNIVSDIYGGFTENKIGGGHGLRADGRSYWLNENDEPNRMQSLEFFAGNFAAVITANNEKVEQVNEYCSGAVKAMEEMIENAQ